MKKREETRDMMKQQIRDKRFKNNLCLIFDWASMLTSAEIKK
jgi:hypothetical protein